MTHVSTDRPPDRKCLGVDRPTVRVYAGRMNWRPYITFEPDKRGGQPCIRGLRITVWDVLEYLAGGMSVGEVLEDFPDLTFEDIRACFAFAADQGRKTVLLPA